MTVPAGARLRDAVAQERPLQIVGAINAYAALLAERAGFKDLYLSGAGVANASFGLPDLGVTSLNDVCEDVRRITSAISSSCCNRRKPMNSLPWCTPISATAPEICFAR